MLASPCGHTVCRQCAYRLCYCPVCHSVIDDRLLNSALQRVVTEHYHHRHQQQQQQQLTQSTDGEFSLAVLHGIDDSYYCWSAESSFWG